MFKIEENFVILANSSTCMAYIMYGLGLGPEHVERKYVSKMSRPSCHLDLGIW
jgi:hypothetical protein